MKPFRYLFPVLLVFFAAAALRANDDYVPGPDSRVQPGVPAGKLFSFVFDQSKLYPGTVRTCWVYIPAQYTPEHPACLYVCQDGVEWNAAIVFDNLIARHEMPVTIGVFVGPGMVARAAPAPQKLSPAMSSRPIVGGTNDPRVAALPLLEAGALPLALGQYNRVYEFSGMNDRYVRFLLEELLPAVAARQTPDGRPIRFSAAANDRAIAGSSAGGICAFNAAWERPEAFSRVFSSCGSFNLGGGEVFPILIRKFEPKALRVFLQDGSHDTGVFAGSWWTANLAAEESLRFSGYEVNHAWGDGGHTAKHALAIFPEAMRWLWKDWPRPIGNSGTENDFLRLALRGGEGWRQVAGDFSGVRGAAVNPRGEVFFADAHRIYRAGIDGGVTVFSDDSGSADDLSFGPDGRLYAVSARSAEVTAYAADGQRSAVAAGIAGKSLTVAHNGAIYVVEGAADLARGRSKIWLVEPDGKKRIVDGEAPAGASGIVLSPDQCLLFVADRVSPWIYRYVIGPDGGLRYRQQFFQLHRSGPDDDLGSEAGLRADRDGRLYVATGLGIQVGAEASLVEAVLPIPGPRATTLCFGGATFDTLYAFCGSQIFRRRLNVNGANGWEAPYEPAPLKPSRVRK